MDWYACRSSLSAPGGTLAAGPAGRILGYCLRCSKLGAVTRNILEEKGNTKLSDLWRGTLPLYYYQTQYSEVTSSTGGVESIAQGGAA